jgi:hypothetical protein
MWKTTDVTCYEHEARGADDDRQCALEGNPAFRLSFIAARQADPLNRARPYTSGEPARCVPRRLRLGRGARLLAGHASVASV